MNEELSVLGLSRLAFHIIPTALSSFLGILVSEIAVDAFFYLNLLVPTDNTFPHLEQLCCCAHGPYSFQFFYNIS